MWKTELESLNGRKGKWNFILLTALFAFLFINTFEPFDTYSSGEPLNQFLDILFATLGLIGASALAHFAFRPVFKVQSFTYLSLIPWYFFELVLVSIAWSAMVILVEQPSESTWSLLLENFVDAAFLLVLPYWGALLILQTRQKLRSHKEDSDPNALVVLREKSGKEKLSLRLADILFLESSDNYVLVHFLENEVPKKSSLRNTLKNLESELENLGLVRCHRSFLVNVSNVVRKEKGSKGYQLYMRNQPNTPVPVSKSYSSEMDKLARKTLG